MFQRSEAKSTTLPAPQTSGNTDAWPGYLRNDTFTTHWRARQIYLTELLVLSHLIKEGANTAIIKVCEKIIFGEAVCTTCHTGVCVQVNHQGSLPAFMSVHGNPRLPKAAQRTVKQRNMVPSHLGFLINLYFSAVSEVPHAMTGSAASPLSCTLMHIASPILWSNLASFHSAL